MFSAVLLMYGGMASAGEARSEGEGEELTVSPLIINVDMDAGESTTQPITIKASGDEPLTLTFEHTDLGFTEDDYEQVLIEDSAEETVPFSTRGWFSVPQARYTLKPDEARTVPLRITVPRNATSGTHIGTAFFRTIAEAKEGGDTQVLTSFRTGAIVFVRVSGGEPPKPRISQLETDRIVDSGPIDVRATISNGGDSHFRVSGEILLEGRKGDGARTDLPERYVVPGIDRTIRQELGTSDLPAGRHTVRVSLRADPGGERLEREVTVWVLPPWLVAVVTLAALVLVAGLVLGTVQLRRLLLIRRYAREELEASLEEDAGTDSEPADDDDLPDSVSR